MNLEFSNQLSRRIFPTLCFFSPLEICFVLCQHGATLSVSRIVLYDPGSLGGSTLLFALQEDEEEGEEEFSQVVSTAELDKLQGLISCSLESSCTDDFLPANYVCLRLHAKLIMNTIMPNCCCKSN